MKRYNISRTVPYLLLTMFYGPAWAGGASTSNMTPIYPLLLCSPSSAPVGVTADASIGAIIYRWDEVTGVDTYNLYQAEESGVTPDNYDSLSGGQLISGVTSPYYLSVLVNGTTNRPAQRYRPHLGW